MGKQFAPGLPLLRFFDWSDYGPDYEYRRVVSDAVLVEELVLGCRSTPIPAESFSRDPDPVSLEAELAFHICYARNRGATTSELDELDACQRRIDEILETPSGVLSTHRRRAAVSDSSTHDHSTSDRAQGAGHHPPNPRQSTMGDGSEADLTSTPASSRLAPIMASPELRVSVAPGVPRLGCEVPAPRSEEQAQWCKELTAW